MLAASQVLLNAQSNNGDTGTTSKAFRCGGVANPRHLIKWGVGVSAGEVTIECADKETFTGNWAPVAVANFADRAVASPRQDYVDVPGTSAGAYRHRITSPVLDGTVTTKILATESQ